MKKGERIMIMRQHSLILLDKGTDCLTYVGLLRPLALVGEVMADRLDTGSAVW